MATKNLARTVIEVGRAPSSKYARRMKRRLDRRRSKKFCYDAENALLVEELGVEPRRERRGYYFQQDDKLSPAMRWLDSRVGQKWNDVFSEMSKKFRQRGIALSHVVDTHMLEWVKRNNDERWRFRDLFEVNEEGILQRKKYPNWRKKYRYRPFPVKKVEEWAEHRRIIIHGQRCWWTDPTEITEINYWGETYIYYTQHKQGEEFNETDYDFWKTVPDYVRRRYIWAA